MRLDRFISNNTEHSQQTVRRLLALRRVKVNGEIVADGLQQISEFCHISLSEAVLQDRRAHYYMLHKPRGYLSATRDPQHRTVMELMDIPDTVQLHIGGRLDFNTSGLMLLTNDGKWSRKITEPQLKHPKVYRVETEDPITPEYQLLFSKGVYLPYENLTTQPAQLDILSARSARLTIYEGRYHQVKRMFGQFDNKVVALHRESMGKIKLDPNLAAGEFRALTAQEILLI